MFDYSNIITSVPVERIEALSILMPPEILPQLSVVGYSVYANLQENLIFRAAFAGDGDGYRGVRVSMTHKYYGEVDVVEILFPRYITASGYPSRKWISIEPGTEKVYATGELTQSDVKNIRQQIATYIQVFCTTHNHQ